jgi:hypothetical protein
LLKKDDIVNLLEPGKMIGTQLEVEKVYEKELPEFVPKIGTKQINKKERIFFRHGGHEYFIKWNKVQKEKVER